MKNHNLKYTCTTCNKTSQFITQGRTARQAESILNALGWTFGRNGKNKISTCGECNEKADEKEITITAKPAPTTSIIPMDEYTCESMINEHTAFEAIQIQNGLFQDNSGNWINPYTTETSADTVSPTPAETQTTTAAPEESENTPSDFELILPKREYDKSKIMREAWLTFKNDEENGDVMLKSINAVGGFMRNPRRRYMSFAHALRAAWRRAKSALESKETALITAIHPEIRAIDSAIRNIKLQDRMTMQDWTLESKLNAKRAKILESIRVA